MSRKTGETWGTPVPPIPEASKDASRVVPKARALTSGPRDLARSSTALATSTGPDPPMFTRHRQCESCSGIKQISPAQDSLLRLKSGFARNDALWKGTGRVSGDAAEKSVNLRSGCARNDAAGK